MKRTLSIFTLSIAAFFLIAAAPSVTNIFKSVTANTNGVVQWPLTLSMSNGTVKSLTVSNNITVLGTNIGGYFSGDGSGLTNLSVAGGSATNAVSKILTNGVQLFNGVTNLNFTNYGVAPSAVGGTVTIDLTQGNATDATKVSTNSGTLWTGRLIGGGSTNFGITNATIYGGSFTNLTNSTATSSRIAAYDASGVLTNASASVTEANYLVGVTGGLQTNIDNRATSAQLTAATNVLVDTNTYRAGTNIFDSATRWTNANVSGGLLTLDFAPAAAGNVACTPGADFRLALTNIPTALPAGKTILLKLQGGTANYIVTMPGGFSLTNRFFNVHSNSYVLPANQHALMCFTFPGNGANGTFSNGFYYWTTNAP